MGNVCGKSADAGTGPPGRRLGSGPGGTSSTGGATSTYGGAINSKPTSSVPPSASKSKTPKIKGPGRTLAEASDSLPNSNSEALDAREAAARAAEAREQATRAAGKGSLGVKLDTQKRQTRNQQIQELSQQKDRNDPLVWD